MPEEQVHNNTPLASLDLIYEIAIQKVTRLQTIVEAQETKASVFITTISITTAAIFSFALGEFHSKTWLTSFAIVLAASVGVGGYALLRCIQALHIKEYPDPPLIRGLREGYLDRDPVVTKDQILANLDAAYETTKNVIDEKADHLKAASRLLKLLVVLLMLAGGMRAVAVGTTPPTEKEKEEKMSDEKETPADTTPQPNQQDTSKKQLTKPDPKLNVNLRESETTNVRRPDKKK